MCRTKRSRRWRASARRAAYRSPGFFKCTIDDVPTWERQLSEELDAAFRQADRLGTDKLIIFAFHKPGVSHQDPMAVEGRDYPEAILDPLRQAARWAEDAGKVLLVENEHVCWGDTGDTTAEIIRRVDSPALRLNWDPGNSAASHATPFPDEAGHAPAAARTLTRMTTRLFSLESLMSALRLDTTHDENAGW